MNKAFSTTDFYKEISRNKWGSFFLVLLFSVFVMLLGYVFSQAFAPGYTISILTITFFIVIIWSLISYYSGDSIVLATAKAKQLTKKDDPFYWNTVEGLSIAVGLPMPKIYLIKEDSINAFATGRNPEHASIAVTTGARKKLNRQEFEGVIAHEMSHVANYDIRFMVLVAVMVGIVVLFSDIMLRTFIFGGARGRNREGGQLQIIFIVVALVLAILAPIIAQLIKLALSRKREYLADSTAVKLTRYPGGLIGALKKIKNDDDKVVDTANKATAHLYLENPLRKKQSWLNNMFSTHPPIDKRISVLESM